MDDEKRVVARDASGAPVSGVKIKTAASEPFFLRAVRDVSLISEDGCECFFPNVADLRRFRLTVEGCSLVFEVRLTNLYPLKPPVFALSDPASAPCVVQGKKRSFRFDARGRLCDDDLVGEGWRPVRGVHDLVREVASELGCAPPLERPWNWFGEGGYGAHVDGPHLFARVLHDGDSLAIVVAEAFAVRPQVGLEMLKETASRVFGALEREMAAVKDWHDRSSVVRVIEQAQFDDEWMGVSVCVASASQNRISCAHLGNVTCHALQTNCRQERELARPHDAFDAAELARVGPDVNIVKHGATVRYFRDLSLVSRCLGLRGCSDFVSDQVVWNSVERSPRDSVLLVATQSVTGCIPPLELASIVCPRISAVEMVKETERISRHRGATGRAFVLACM